MNKRIKIKILLSVLPFFVICGSLFGIFLAGSTASSTKLDQYATNQRVVVKENKINYLGIYLKEEENSPLPNNVSEFYNNYSTFRQDIANFIPAINVEKEIPVYFNEINITNPLSMFYFGPIRSTSDNKDFNFPFQYMFPSVKNYPKNKYVINISKTQADLLLEERGIEKSNEGYYSLLFTPTSIKVDGIDYDFQIGNIFLEENYYYKATKEMLNEFVMISYYYPKVLVKDYLYLFNEFEFQNSYYIDYLKNTYDSSKNKMYVNHNNLNKNIDDSKLINFYIDDSRSNNNLAITLASIFSILAVLSLGVSCFIFKSHKKFIYIMPLLICSLMPYLVFKFIYNHNFSRLYFSSFSAKINSYLVICLLLIYLIFYIANKIRAAKTKDKTICSNI